MVTNSSKKAVLMMFTFSFSGMLSKLPILLDQVEQSTSLLEYMGCLEIWLHNGDLGSIFLVMLVSDNDLKDFRQQVVFHRLLAGLSDIERNGIPHSGGFPNGKLFALLGDNLGSRFVGGFLESFSGEYFCRYCLITKSDFQEEPYLGGVPRTVQHYKDTISTLKNKPELMSYQGLKFDSVFNTLRFLPRVQVRSATVSGHDLFEGVVAYGMVLIIRSMVQFGWFSYGLLNERTLDFKYATGCKDRPAQVHKKSSKLLGNAMENW